MKVKCPETIRVSRTVNGSFKSYNNSGLHSQPNTRPFSEAVPSFSFQDHPAQATYWPLPTEQYSHIA